MDAKIEIPAILLAMIPALALVLQMVKQYIPDSLHGKLLPLMSLAVGIVMAIMYVPNPDIIMRVMVGIMLGLGPTGLHAQIKATKKAISKS